MQELLFFLFLMNLKQEQEQNEQKEEEHEGTQVQQGLGQLEEVLCTRFYRGEEPHGRPTIVVAEVPSAPFFLNLAPFFF